MYHQFSAESLWERASRRRRHVRCSLVEVGSAMARRPAGLDIRWQKHPPKVCVAPSGLLRFFYPVPRVTPVATFVRPFQGRHNDSPEGKYISSRRCNLRKRFRAFFTALEGPDYGRGFPASIFFRGQKPPPTMKAATAL